MDSYRKIVLLLFLAFLVGLLVPRPSIDRVYFLVRSPRESLNYRLTPTSFRLFHVGLHSRISKGKGLLNAISRLPEPEVQSFVATRLKSLAEHEEYVREQMRVYAAEIDNGARFFEYATRGGAEGGVLLLHRGRVLLKEKFYGGIEGL